MKRIGQSLIEKWKEKLSERLGRSEDELSTKGLGAADFSSNSTVRLDNPDNLHCIFERAFCLIDAERGRVAVFTEHSGYHEFYLSGMKVSESKSTEYRDEDYDA